MFRLLAALCGLSVVLSSTAISHAQTLPSPQPTDLTPRPTTSVVISGRGNAHGMGLAMDGVLGQIAAGWPYSKVLRTFYTGVTSTKAAGQIRVGLSDSDGQQAVLLPDGGTVSDAPAGQSPGPGFPIRAPAGARVVVNWSQAGGYKVRLDNVVVAAQILNTPAPSASPSPGPGSSPSPTPGPGQPTPVPPSSSGSVADSPIWIVPSGSPALMRLDATGRRYRGTMQVRASGSRLWAINHVDLETYVQGIAEEKGAGWSDEALKVLAVASRTLAVATRTWYSKHQTNGFDICPTAQCQVYLGYDGEEAGMTRAAKATSGEILTYDGKAILAMYHGNGGGHTETNAGYPYLKGVAYPFSKPKLWEQVTTPDAFASGLRAAGVQLPGIPTGVTILETGDSPRVKRVRIDTAAGSVEATGATVKDAFALPTTWFEVKFVQGTVVAADPPPVLETREFPQSAAVRTAALPVLPSTSRESLPLALVASAVALLAGAFLATGEHHRRRRPNP